MSLAVPAALLTSITDGVLLPYATAATQRHATTVEVRDADLTDDVLAALVTAAADAGDRSFGRILGSIAAARAGDFSTPIPKFAAAPQVIIEFLKHKMIHGWVFRQHEDGHLHPYLVTGVHVDEPRNASAGPRLVIHLMANGGTETLGGARDTVRFDPATITRKRVSDIFTAAGLYKETPELVAEHAEHVQQYLEILGTGFAHQYRYTGTPLHTDWRARGPRESRKVIHDIAVGEVPAFADWAPSALYAMAADSTGDGPVPIRTVLRVFDLAVHDTIWVNTRDLTVYEYDQSLREKIILPPDQRELLDILVTDISTFTADIIEGKSAGNVILAKGKPGVGKTLTAEVYSELISRPLYSVHSGSLGVSADTVRKNLELTFRRAKRWDAVLLLDEADVFVIERGANIEQNAIVAEFLRTLEYFDGLMFMTTNRPDDIDEAILSRCAAIVDYQVPGREGARAVWEVQAANSRVTLPEALLDELVTGFDGITPRDIKMLLRLALRVAAHRNEDLTFDLFARCAIFRGHHARTTTHA